MKHTFKKTLSAQRIVSRANMMTQMDPAYLAVMTGAGGELNFVDVHAGTFTIKCIAVLRAG
jgi:hypothetical protein